ncbi:MAG: replicative DNA helicase, partial [Bacteroidales bacterium]
TQVGLTEIIIAKHRNGSVCDVQMRFRSSEVKFVDITDASLDMPSDNADSSVSYGSKMNSVGDFGNNEFGGNNEF